MQTSLNPEPVFLSPNLLPLSGEEDPGEPGRGSQTSSVLLGGIGLLSRKRYSK